MLRGATILFDLDGTMIDTAPDLIHATNHTLALNGMARVEAHVIEPAVSIGSRAMISAAIGSLGREVSDDALTRMTEEFNAYYAENVLVDSRPFPGLQEAMDGLRGEGALLGVCTNKREALAKKLIGALGYNDYFLAIVGRDTFPQSKPHPAHVLNTIRVAGGDKARAAMIGDSSADSRAAQGAGVPFIGVTFGYGEKPITVLKPDAVIDTFAELIPALRSVLAV
jgi:phosphoglycolate phosphatase